jgi:hypothetical protein
MANPKLRVDVNHNPTKKGIKVQFVMPETLEGDAKAEMTQKLQSKLNQGLSQYNLTVSQDTDVPYANVIGFLIPIADVKLMIKNAISGGGTAAPEEPVAEIKRMQELAGLSNEDLKSNISRDLEKVSGLSTIDPVKLKNLSKELLRISNQMDFDIAGDEMAMLMLLAFHLTKNPNKAKDTIQKIDDSELYDQVYNTIDDIYPELLDMWSISLSR